MSNRDQLEQAAREAEKAVKLAWDAVYEHDYQQALTILPQVEASAREIWGSDYCSIELKRGEWDDGEHDVTSIVVLLEPTVETPWMQATEIYERYKSSTLIVSLGYRSLTPAEQEANFALNKAMADHPTVVRCTVCRRHWDVASLYPIHNRACSHPDASEAAKTCLQEHIDRATKNLEWLKENGYLKQPQDPRGKP